MYRWLKTFLASVLFLLVFASAAHALSWSDAWNKTYGENASDCRNVGNAFYYCQIPNWELPRCYYTGVDQPGHVEWNCYGAFVQGPRYPGVPYVGVARVCHVYYGWGPYGGLDSQSRNCASIGGVG